MGASMPCPCLNPSRGRLHVGIQLPIDLWSLPSLSPFEFLSLSPSVPIFFLQNRNPSQGARRRLRLCGAHLEPPCVASSPPCRAASSGERTRQGMAGAARAIRFFLAAGRPPPSTLPSFGAPSFLAMHAYASRVRLCTSPCPPSLSRFQNRHRASSSSGRRRACLPPFPR